MHLADTTTFLTPDPYADASVYNYTVGAPAATGVAADAAPSWVTDISNVLTQGLNLYGQLRLQDLNMNLIQQGKPPLTASQVSAMAPQLNVGLAPDVQNAIFKYTLFGGAAVLAIVILMGSNKRQARRR